MREHVTAHMQPKFKMGALTAIAGAAVIIAALAFSIRVGAAPGATLVVDDDGQATAGNCNSGTVTPYTAITPAVAAAAAGDTVKVCPGAYAEDVVIDKALTLKGAKSDSPVAPRVFGAADEATVTGLVTVQAADVKLYGFSLTNPGQGLGVVVKTAADNAVIKKNIVKTVGSNTFAGPTVGIYLELGPDHVTVSNNRIGDIQSQTGSAQGILVGDSTSANPSLDTTINSNTISDIASVQRGAYGVQVNNGASAAPASTGYAEADISGNTIKDLAGNWTHAIGLEGETPNVVVSYNTISNLADNNPVPIADVVGVYFESNAFFFTGEVNHNSLDVGAAGYGIAVNPALAAHYASLSVDGECNWWGDSSGPSAVGSGSGSLVGGGVDYTKWLKSSRLDRDCGEKRHSHKGHHHSWNYRFDNDWRH
jgi:hypothetical protein